MGEYEQEYFDMVVKASCFGLFVGEITDKKKEIMRPQIEWLSSELRELRKLLGYSPVSSGDRLETDGFLFDPKGQQPVSIYDKGKAVKLAHQYISDYATSPSSESAKRLEIGLCILNSPELCKNESADDVA